MVNFGCTCYHPLFVFNQFGDLERCALRPGNVHSAHGWQDVLEPVVARCQDKIIRRYFCADAAFANPEVYEFLKAEGFTYAIRLPANKVLQSGLPIGRDWGFVFRVDGFQLGIPVYCMSYRRGEAEYFGSSAPGMRMKVASLFLAPGHRFFWNQVRTKLTDAGVRAPMELPRPLAFLYYLLRVPLWLTRQSRSDR